MTTELIVWSVLIGVGVGGSAIWSGMETGLYRASRVRAAAKASAPNARLRSRLLMEELRHPDRALTALLIANNVCNYVGSLGVVGLLTLAKLSDAQIIGLQALVLTPILLVFAESLPKELFRVDADRLCQRLAPALTLMRLLATVCLILPVVLWVTRRLTRLFGAPGVGALSGARERIVSIIKHDAEGSGLSDEQATLIERALAFGRARVAQEMIPWKSVRWVSADAPRARLDRVLAQTGHARIPVVDRTGRVQGVLARVEAALNPEAEVRELVRPTVRLNPGLSAREALARIRSEGARLAIVERDGRPLGVVSPKDLFEPLMGELQAW
jgi:CBS domain containing-hemolysin-like protein